MSRLLKITTGLLLVPVVAFSGPAVSAAAVGSIEGGNIYRVKNVTRNTAFTDPVDADKCETVQFRVRIHNPGPDSLTGVKVKATLPSAASTSHSSEVTVSADNANPTSRTDTAAVNLPAAYSIDYENNSTELLDTNSAVLQTLPNGIVGDGVMLPNGVGVSLNQIRFVQFKANINCPEKPTPTPTPTPTPAPSKTPEVLPNTGAGAVLGMFAGASAAGAAAHYAVSARRNRREQ